MVTLAVSSFFSDSWSLLPVESLCDSSTYLYLHTCDDRKILSQSAICGCFDFFLRKRGTVRFVREKHSVRPLIFRITSSFLYFLIVEISRLALCIYFVIRVVTFYVDLHLITFHDRCGKKTIVFAPSMNMFRYPWRYFGQGKNIKIN